MLTDFGEKIYQEIQPTVFDEMFFMCHFTGDKFEAKL